MKAIFLYTELADYTMACFKKHLERHPEDEIHVVHYPVNPEAPFHFESVFNLFLYSRAEMEIADVWDIFNRSQPDVILCSGWNDAFYNKFVKAVCKLVPVYLCFDNVFRYTLKQVIGLGLARWMFRGVYTGVWVPGAKQVEFARLLGFPPERIYTGFYSTDTQRFSGMYEANKESKERQFPRKFLCVARYVPQKGLEAMWEAFSDLCNEEQSDWEMWCAGTGENFEDRMIHPKIKHLGFVQPKDFDHLVQECGVFILPSMFEPWGVAVNEFAAAGFPMILSKRVGSSAEFLEEGVNGFGFMPGKTKQIKEAMKKMMGLPTETLVKMGEESHRISNKYNAVGWSETLETISGKAF
jgi:glycosyltransferase involved in cell wall biosynthesis